MYRTDPPPPMSELAEQEVPFDLAVESIFYYEVHERPSKWSIMAKVVADWAELVSLWRENGLSHRGIDYPDWRQFALLDLSMPTRANTCTRLAWYEHYEPDYDTASHFFTDVAPRVGDDPVALLAMIRSGLDAGESDIPLYAGSLLHCKHLLIKGDRKRHDTLLPLYISAYSLFLSKLGLHHKILEKNMFWGIHSTMHLWSKDVGNLESRAFEDDESWMLAELGLIISVLS